MKRAVLIFTVLSTLAAGAQPAPTAPAAPTTPSGGLPASPTTPGLPASPTERGLPTQNRPGLPGFTNTGGILAPTNRLGTNQLGDTLRTSDFVPLLGNLQNNLQQLLPALAAINDNIALGNLTATNIGLGATNAFIGLTTTTVGANFSGNTSADLSSGRGVNLGANFATPAGGPPAPAPTATLDTSAAAGSLFPPSPTGATTPSGLPPGSAVGVGADATTPVAAAGTVPTANALLILQSDIQRMLPLVAALNGGNVDLAALINNPGAFTNVVTNVFGTPPEQLVPAGPSRLLAPNTVPGTTTIPARQP